MRKSILVRPLHWTDLPAAAEMEAEAFSQDAWSIETFWTELAGVPARRRYLCASESGRLVAYAGLALASPESDIQTVVVAQPHQGLGVGRYLVTELMRIAITEGCRWTHLEVRADNSSALGLYRSLGFEQISRRSGYYSNAVDALILRADLAAVPVPRTTPVSSAGAAKATRQPNARGPSKKVQG